jgi:hypothetical protein
MKGAMDFKGPVSFIGRTPAYLKTALLGESACEYWLHYFGNRRFPKDQEFYVVYTSLDHRIPFQPDTALDYWAVNLDFVPTFFRLGGVTSRASFNVIRRAYVDIAREGCAAFRQVPTVMPRFRSQGSRALRAAHGLLRPINCSPSLHTAVPFFAYNLGAHYFPEREPQLRQYVGDIVSTVIKSKLHALVDVAFGILVARKAVTGTLGLAFNDLEFFFTHGQHGKDGVPYDQVYRMYREITDLDGATGRGGGGLPAVMRRYFEKVGLPRVSRERADCLFDLDGKVLVYPPDLRVGSGLF